MGTDEPRRFSREFKLEVLRRMEAGENVSVLARELGVSRKSIYKWRERYRLGGSLALRIRGRTTSAEAAAMKMHQTKPPEGNSSPDNPPSLEELARAQRLHSALDYLSPDEYEMKISRLVGVPPQASATETCP